tara:strand:+ start:251 stop:1063 length:813 start_codon:yes stop_codon:yes gene_type:complete
MGNRRIGRKRLEHALKNLNGTTPDSTGSRSGLRGVEIPAFELQPSKYYGLFDDFVSLSAGTGVTVDGDMASTHGGQVWLADVGGTNDTITLVSSETAGVVKIHTGDTDNDTTTLTAANASFAIDAASARKLWFETRIKANDITDLSIFVGLASANGAIETDAAGQNWEDALGFYIVEGAASQDIVVLGASGDTETTTSLSTDLGNAYVVLSLHFNGTSVEAYVNGTLKATITSGLPNDGTVLFPTISASTRDNGGGDDFFCDYVRICQER